MKDDSPKRIYLVCPVRNVDPETQSSLENYVSETESRGARVHFPPRDVDQSLDAFTICEKHRDAMRNADEVHIWWDDRSRGSLFDFGMAYALGLPIKIVNDVEPDEGKSYKNVALKLTSKP